jgi:flavin-binding protein dodecin
VAEIVKIIDLIGSSDKSWSDAAKQAVAQASQTIRGINGIDVVSSSATVKDGEISEYRVTVRIAFPVERADS